MRPAQRRTLPLLAATLTALLAACGEGGPLPFVPTPEPTAEPPRDVVVRVVDRSGEPVVGAFLDGEATSGLTGEDGAATLHELRGSEVEVSAGGHDPASAEVPAEGDLVVELRANVVRGTVTDGAGEPLAGVRVFVDGASSFVTTDENGSYELGGVDEDATLIFKRAGHRLGVIESGDATSIDVALERFEARALYAPGEAFEEPGRLDALLELLDTTEANALVIDVKETDGRLYYATDLAPAVEIGAVRDAPLFELEELLPMLRERGIYTIARVVTMKDNTLTAARPELAVQRSDTGEPWRDNLGGAWLDPSAPGVAEYVAAIALDLAERGFDEVQLDYIRFYSDGPYELADTNVPNTQPLRLSAIGRFLRVVSDVLATERAFLAADVFPISFILADDQGIGQRPDAVMPYVDYACPMAYPSHFGPGVFGLAVPNDHPFEVVDATLEIMNGQAAEWGVALRPWIQDFGYGQFPPYSPSQVRAQMEAAEGREAHGWMIWNPFGNFSQAALGPARPGEEAAPVTEPMPTGAPAGSAGASDEP